MMWSLQLHGEINLLLIGLRKQYLVQVKKSTQNIRRIPHVNIVPL